MKPIPFSTPMVKAILDGRKTQTRRVVKAPVLQDVREPNEVYWKNGKVVFNWYGETVGGFEVKPKYQPGDILWVRETWFENEECLLYKASKYENTKEYHGRNGWVQIKWRPSIFMPREAARIFLKVTNVRVERLQEITEEDAIAEGISWLDEACYSNNGWTPTLYDPDSGGSPVFRDGFTALWDSINAKRGYGWDTNPWVWVYEFKRIGIEEVRGE
jgi:hypothetical protein